MGDIATLEGNEDYRSFIDRLTDSNVDKYIDLPMIAVMGDTSSGKSSLLSMLSAIELPSSDELTTRCPIMLKMARAQTKAARVEVIWKDKPSGKSEDEILFPAENIDASSWDDLTGVIARAQQHIVQKSGKEVARDVVSVKLESPSCENLTLIDLPGIVRATGRGESATLAEDIQSLIEDYLKNPRCVILAVHPCNVDFHNSQIMAEARRVDPATHRTIPVLTKPDLIDEGAEFAVRDLLLGLKTDDFKQGFHMVKGRGQAALNGNESIKDGLTSEESFFRTTQPWRDIDDKSLLGTKNLRVRLSSILMGLIRHSFPSIIKEMKREKMMAEEAFQVLGEVPDSGVAKRTYFNLAKNSFIKSLQPVLTGIRTNNVDWGCDENCSAQFHVTCEEFKEQLLQSGFSTMSDIRVGCDVTYIKDGCVEKGTVTFMDKERIYVSDYLSKTKYQSTHEVGHVWKESGNVWKVGDSSNTLYELRPYDKALVQRDPEWILQMIKKHRTYTLPVFVNSQIFEKIVSDAIESQWKAPSLGVLEELSADISKSIEKQINSDPRLGRFPKFLKFLSRKCEDVVESATQETKKKLEDFIKAEKVPYSQDHYLFENIAKKRHQFLLERIKSTIPEEPYSIESTEVLEIIENAFEANRKKSVDEHMAEEMLHILDGYGKVAVKRFIDTVPMLCADGLIHGLDDKLNEVLSVISDTDIENILTVPKDEHVKRDNLKRKIETLEEGIRVFDELF